MDSIKKNNSGFTLIELLLTIVIIGIIAVPFLNSFIQAMSINVEARRLQNATLVAQDLAEEFKAETLSDLLNSTAYQDKVSEVEHTVNGKILKGYKFTGIKVAGADNEDFYVDIELDPSVVVDSEGNAVNGDLLPLFSNLYGGDTLIMFKQYVESDSTVNKQETKKISNITIECQETHISGSDYSYTYKVTLENRYEYNDGTSTDIISKYVEKTYSGDDKHTAYLLASVFDKYTQGEVDSEGDYYATDKINIKFTYLGDTSRQKDFTFYLAEQAPNNVNNGAKLSRLKPENINITYGSETKTLSEYDSSSSKFKINTNVGKEIDDTVSDGSLTYDPNNIGDSLFMMDIKVHYGKADGEVLTTFTTTKEE